MKNPLVLFSAALVFVFTACTNSVDSNSTNEINPKFPTPIAASEDGSAGKDGTYVLFGEWPQSLLKKEDISIIDESVSKTVGMFTYYKGGDDWYAKIEADPEEPDSYDTYYKVEPIKWRVLNPTAKGSEKKILLAEKILINCPYYDYGETRKIGDDDKIEANNYEHSRVRAFLNGLEYQVKANNNAAQMKKGNFKNKGFLHTAFTKEERAAIADTSVANDARSTNPDGDENEKIWNEGRNQYARDTPTNDKIFLLSEQEASKNKYGFAEFNINGQNGRSRILKVTDFAKAMGVQYTPNELYGGYWWLRSPYYGEKDEARYVNDSGEANRSITVLSSHVGVVPALCLIQK